VPPGAKPDKTVPIKRYNVRSFITSHLDGAKVKAGQNVRVRGIAFDGGSGIRQVLFSPDDGRTWGEAELGRDLGKYSFREWTTNFTPPAPGKLTLKVKATTRAGQTQPEAALWNPAGYMRNVIETTVINAA